MEESRVDDFSPTHSDTPSLCNLMNQVVNLGGVNIPPLPPGLVNIYLKPRSDPVGFACGMPIHTFADMDFVPTEGLRSILEKSIPIVPTQFLYWIGTCVSSAYTIHTVDRSHPTLGSPTITSLIHQKDLVLRWPEINLPSMIIVPSVVNASNRDIFTTCGKITSGEDRWVSVSQTVDPVTKSIHGVTVYDSSMFESLLMASSIAYTIDTYNSAVIVSPQAALYLLRTGDYSRFPDIVTILIPNFFDRVDNYAIRSWILVRGPKRHPSKIPPRMACKFQYLVDKAGMIQDHFHHSDSDANKESTKTEESFDPKSFVAFPELGKP